MSAPDRGRDRVAAIDIGTNSVLLLIAERAPDGALGAVLERATITRLGQGVDRTRELAEPAIERTLACLASYADDIARLGASRVDAVGTSAMRDARGGEAFRKRALSLLGVEPRVIGGDEEARLTFVGGLSGLDRSFAAMEVGVFDIGGGSTELIRGHGHRIASAISLDVGSVRLTERHVRSDPPSSEDLAACARDIDAILATGPDMRGVPLVGVAGTVTTVAAIARKVVPYDGARVHGARLTTAEVRGVFDALAAAPLDERRAMPGLSPERADVIVAGALLCSRILERAGASELVVSDRGVRWGVAEELARAAPA